MVKISEEEKEKIRRMSRGPQRGKRSKKTGAEKISKIKEKMGGKLEGFKGKSRARFKATIKELFGEGDDS